MDPMIEKAVGEWLNEPAIAEADKEEIRSLLRASDEKELTDRFYRDLEFGTGGMRGLIGAGRNRMNVYTVGAAGQGLANYVARQGEAAKKAGVAIAYDSRRCSDLFAERTAAVLAGNGITAYLFERLRPTPELSFAVRHLGCTAGVVITASHNPAAYNGYKVYWSDGVQVVPPHDRAITDEVRGVGGFGNVRVMDPAAAKSQGLIRMIGREVDEAFLAQVWNAISSTGLTMSLAPVDQNGYKAEIMRINSRWGFFSINYFVAAAGDLNGDRATELVLVSTGDSNGPIFFTASVAGFDNPVGSEFSNACEVPRIHWRSGFRIATGDADGNGRDEIRRDVRIGGGKVRGGAFQGG